MNADSFAWAPLCIGVTAVGLVLSWLAWRRRGASSGMRGAAYSLLPLGLYLTGVIPLLWRIGSQIVGWAAGLIFKPTVWAGTIVLGLAVLLWIVSGMMLRRKVTKSNRGEVAEGDTPGATPKAAGGAAKRPAVERTVATGQSASASGDDDMKDIEELLRRRGIE
ncbi:MAG TPA: cellulose synthase [Streptosporangiaceae bacterium]|jgi:hypothetical protein